MCMAKERPGTNTCTTLPTSQVETRAPADLRAQVEAFRAMLREARERELTLEEQDAVAEVAETIRTLLGEKDLL
jgi:hypothetical protein